VGRKASEKTGALSRAQLKAIPLFLLPMTNAERALRCTRCGYREGS